jgi:hypothetical protein
MERTSFPGSSLLAELGFLAASFVLGWLGGLLMALDLDAGFTFLCVFLALGAFGLAVTVVVRQFQRRAHAPLKVFGVLGLLAGGYTCLVAGGLGFISAEFVIPPRLTPCAAPLPNGAGTVTLWTKDSHGFLDSYSYSVEVSAPGRPSATFDLPGEYRQGDRVRVYLGPYRDHTYVVITSGELLFYVDLTTMDQPGRGPERAVHVGDFTETGVPWVFTPDPNAQVVDVGK